MEYLLRVLLHVIGIGVIAALAIGWSPVVHWLRSRLPAGHPRDDDG